ncbi:MAG: acyltransferase [Deltaproteobacteria bacterium]|nr:acyltransferase [Deltaproteobacteria bacterium]
MSQELIKVDSTRIEKVLITSKVVPVVVFLFGTLLVFNMLQTLSLVLLPFSRKAFRAFNRWGANTWWGWCVSVAKILYDTRLELTGDNVPEREKVILVSNHQEMADIPVLMILARSKKRLGDMKWFVKDIVKWIPGVGWGMLFIDCLFVRRDWSRDQESIEKTFSTINKGHVPLWLILFPEGTRSTPAKIEKSRQYARDKNLTPLKHLLIPRTKGFVASVIGLRNHLHAVYDITIGYKNGIPTLWQYILGYSRISHMHVRRFAISELPESGEALTRWLHDRFVEKDRILDYFYKNGEFPKEPEPATTAEATQ